MKKTNTILYSEMIATAARYISAAVAKHLPDSDQKSFMLWILAEGNPYQEDYLRMMGVAGSIELEISLFKKVINASILRKLSHHIGLLNAYFAFETLSDNIEIGLGEATKYSNSIYAVQRDLIIGFNHAMIAKLEGEDRPAVELLMPFRDLTKKISAYEKCLAPAKMYQFAREFQKQYPNTSWLELEYSYFPILVLNIHTCLDLLNSLREHPVYPILKESLIARYTAVNQLLQADHNITLAALAEIGAKSILVIPSLAFCIGALDTVSPNPRLAQTVKDDSLNKSLYYASSLVRLLNDVGTALLTLNNKDRNKFFADLLLLLPKKQSNSIFDFLQFASTSKEFSYLMPRIRKDIQQGEFNICLDHLMNATNIPYTLNKFFDRIIFYTDLYKNQKQELQNATTALNVNLADNHINQVVVNFVKFHQRMYGKEYETKYGDYAITYTSVKNSTKKH